MSSMRCSWLCGISRSFLLLSPAQGQVTYVLLTRSPLIFRRRFVRLACIRHAASVHPEPGSNSPQKITLASVVYFTEFTGSTKMLFPITLQLLRCLPFERTIFYLLYNHLSRFYTDQNTDAVSFASVHQAAKLICFVSLM